MVNLFKMPKMVNLASFSKPEVCGQTVLPDRSIEQNIDGKCQNKKMRHFQWFSNVMLKMTRLNLANVVISKIVHKRTFFLFVKLNDEREALGFFCLPPNLIYRKFLIRLGRMWNDSGLFSLIKNYRHLSFSVVMLTLSESS